VCKPGQVANKNQMGEPMPDGSWYRDISRTVSMIIAWLNVQLVFGWKRRWIFSSKNTSRIIGNAI